MQAARPARAVSAAPRLPGRFAPAGGPRHKSKKSINFSKITNFTC